MKIKKKQFKRLLEKSGEYKITVFTFWISIFITMCVGGYVIYSGISGNSNDSIRYFMYLVLVANIVTAGYSLFIKLLIRRDLSKEGKINNITRYLSILFIPMGLSGNIFAIIAFLTNIKKSRSLEYRLAYFASIINTLLLVIAYINLFKDNVTLTQYYGVNMILWTNILLWILTLITGILTTQNSISPKLKIVGYLFLLLTISGNLLCLLTGLVIVFKVKNIGSQRSIMWIDVIRRLLRNPTAVAGLMVIVFLIDISLYSFFIFDYSLAVVNDYNNIFATPSLKYPFGADEYGRDVYSRIIFGAGISLSVGLISTILPIIAGGILGSISGYYGNKIDNVIMRFLDVLYAIPGILLAVAIVASFGPSTFNLIMALSIGGIPAYARTVRAQVMQLSNDEFIEAARALGAKDRRIIFNHIIPNSLSPVIVRASLSIGSAVLATSALSFLGLGVQPPTPEWGNILKAGSEYLEFYPHLAIYPGIAIIIVVLAFNFLGDGLRDALDPKLK